MTNDTGFDLGQLAGLREWQRSNSGDNSGMHAGSTEGSSYRQQPDNKEQYGSKKSSYWQEKGSDRKQSVGSRMNEESLKQKQ